jgi:methionine synthase I (cobalamin-dependent)
MATVLGIHDYSVLNVYLVYSVQSSSDTERLSWNYRFQVPSLGDGNDDGIWHRSVAGWQCIRLLLSIIYWVFNSSHHFFSFMIHFYLVDSGFTLVKAAAFWLGLYSIGWLL